jgi:CRISPR/Cas system-associated exonuclease Cas4 (RecB family)
MDASNAITVAVFSAFLKCPTKAHLVAVGEPAPGAFFAGIEAHISSMYKSAAQRRLPIAAGASELVDFGQLRRSPDYEAITHYVDCDTAVYDFAPPPHRPRGHKPQESSPSGTFVPVRLLPWDKPDLSDSLLVCFGALALSRATGILADTGTLIYGDGYRRRTVRIGNHVTRARQIIDAIGAVCRDQKPPPLVLNRHCAVCDFQSRCRGLVA